MSHTAETVGGPIDVALIISKGDGLIWIKRKHYFSPELNPQFTALSTCVQLWVAKMKSRKLEELAEKLQKTGSKSRESEEPKEISGRAAAADAGDAAARKVVASFRKALAHAN